MKVLQIIPNFALAGAETMCANLCLQLHNREIDVAAISLYEYHSSLTDMLEDNGINVFYLNKKRGVDLSIIRKIKKIATEIHPDIIHTHLSVMPYVVPASILLRNTKIIHTVHNTVMEEAKPSTRRLNRWIYRFNCVTPVAISNAVQKSVFEYYHVKYVPMIYNGIDLSKCIEKRDYSATTGLSYIHVGRFSEQKNHEMLIDAFKIVHEKLPYSELHLIGEGELKDRIKCKVNELGLTKCVYFEGIQKNVFPFLASADVFVFPSKWEGFGIALVEAMATGLPAVVSGVGGIPELIEHGVNGEIVDLDAYSIASGMLKMVDKEYRKKLGIASRKRAFCYFSNETMAEKYIQIYKYGEL